jgi:hypothetical protein
MENRNPNLDSTYGRLLGEMDPTPFDPQQDAGGGKGGGPTVWWRRSRRPAARNAARVALGDVGAVAFPRGREVNKIVLEQ